MRPDPFITFLAGCAVGTQAFAAAVYFVGVPDKPGKTVLIRALESCGVERQQP